MQLMNLLKVCKTKIISTPKEQLAPSFKKKKYSFIINHIFPDIKYAVKDISEGSEYEFRVTAINESGSGDPSPPSAMVCAKNPNSKS